MNFNLLLEDWCPGHSLPQVLYNDPAVFAHDLDRVFGRQWLAVGHVARIRQPGAYFLYDIGNESIIIVLDRDDAIHALYNVCRHRGSRLCYESAGVARGGLVCPYHAWAYGHDGTLRGASAMPEDFDKSAHGLKQCHLRILAGVIFICLADEPPDFDAMISHMGPFLDPHEVDNAAIAKRMTWSIDANWKLVMENFSECYHCGPAHPEYCSVMAHAIPDCTGVEKYIDGYQSLVDAWTVRTEAMGHLTGSTKDTLTEYFAGRMPIGEGKVSQSCEGRQIAPLLGRHKENDGGLTIARVYPGSYVLACPDHAVVIRFTPRGVHKTEQEITWLVHPDAIEGVDYQVDDLTWFWRVTSDQDKKIIEYNQRGVNSAAYRPGPYSKTERSLVSLTEWYLKQVRS